MKDNDRAYSKKPHKEEKLKAILMLSMLFTHLAGYLCFLKMFDRERLYFTKDIASYILIGVWLITTVACVAYSLRSDRSSSFKKKNDTSLSVTTCAVIVAAGIAAGIASKDIIFCILALISLIYFLPQKINIPTIARALCGIAAIALLIYCVAITYFDYSVPVNSPAKVLRLLGLGAVALFVVYDIRADLGLTSERAYNVTGSIAMITLSLCMPTSIALKDTNGSLPMTLLTFAMLAYMLNFLLAKRIPEERSTDTPNNQEQAESCENNDPKEDTDK